MEKFGSHLAAAAGGRVAVLALFALAALGPLARADEAPPGRGAWLGVTTRRLSEGWRERNAYWSAGVMVVRVAPGSPADQAGIGPGDVVESVDGRRLREPADLSEIEAGMEPGRAVEVVLARDGGRTIKMFNVEPAPVPGAVPERIMIREVPPPAPVPAPVTPPQEPSAPTLAPQPEATPKLAEGTRDAMTELGVHVQDLGPDLAAALGAADAHGALVLDVTSGGAADQAGIKAGDVISMIGEKTVDGVAGLDQAVAAAPSVVSITALRHGAPQELKLALVGHPAPQAEAATPQPAPATPTAGDDWRDRTLLQMQEELQSLRKEVQELRAQIARLRAAGRL